MLKFLINIFVYATMLAGANMETKTIQQYINSPAQAQVIVDNNYYNVDNVEDFQEILNNMLINSRTMPAFGVSIHTETLKAVKKGVWLKLQYNGLQEIEGMTFDELLIEINPKFSGFNIIRGNRGIYEGRCFYIDLADTTMKSLYDFINLDYTSIFL